MNPGADGQNKTRGRERRQQERFECSGFAEVIVENAPFLFRGRIRDLSLTGCYIESSARLILDRGTTVELRFMLNHEELRLAARVMIIRPRAGAGFEFVDLDPELRSRLASLIHNLANSTIAAGTMAAKAAGGDATGNSSRELWGRDR